MIEKAKVLQFIKEKGPVLPRDIVKQFGGDTFITGAMLSSIVDTKELKISHAKIGGSPVYYLQGQEERLSMLFQYLPGKEKEAFTLLKDMKLIKDSTAEPAIRVALRSIKDFAKPIEVNLGEKKEVFWKWHLFSNNDAEKAIKEFFLPKQDTKSEEKTVEKTPEAKQPEKKSAQKIKQEETKQEQKKLMQEEKPKEEKTKEDAKEEKETELLFCIKKLFNEKGIEILETRVIRKNSEIEMLINLPSPAGKLKYFCKIRDKKKTNDRDLSSLFVQTQMKKMPALYVTTGEMTKKAKEMLENEFKIISVMNI